MGCHHAASKFMGQSEAAMDVHCTCMGDRGVTLINYWHHSVMSIQKSKQNGAIAIQRNTGESPYSIRLHGLRLCARLCVFGDTNAFRSVLPKERPVELHLRTRGSATYQNSNNPANHRAPPLLKGDPLTRLKNAIPYQWVCLQNVSFNIKKFD